MHYLITAGSSYDGEYEIVTVVEGPEGFDVDGLWRKFEEQWIAVSRRDVIGYRNLLSKEFGVFTMDSRVLTRAFVAMLVRDHGFIEPAYEEIHTE